MTELTDDTPLGWWTLSTARAAWPDAVKLPDESLARVLAVAFGQCRPKAVVEVTVDAVASWVAWSKVPDGYVVDDEQLDRLRQAQLLQARSLWAFERTGGGDVIGGDGVTVRTYPMGWQVEALLRPDESLGVIG